MKLKFFLAIAFMSAIFPTSSAIAMNPALRQVFRASTTMEAGIDRCASKSEGKAFLDCVANELNKYSGRLSIKGAELLVPQGAPNAATASTGVRASPTAAAAASVLNRAASVVGSLAATSEKYTRQAYTRINQAFTRAALVLGSRS